MVIKLSARNMEATLAEAVRTLRHGGIVAYSTDTFYGLGAKYDIAPALQRLRNIKQRPGEKAMPLIIGEMAHLAMLTDKVPESAVLLIRKFWPGPLTLLFEARGGLSDFIVADNKVAVRMPGESFALRLARAAGFPVTATSANISGLPPGKNASMVADYFGDTVDLIIDGGESQSTLPSTIVDVSGAELTVLRRGAVEI